MLRYPIWRSEITPGCETCVIVIGGDAHDMSPESPKDSPLLRLCVYVRPHLLCRTMFDGYLLPIDLVLNEKILYQAVLSGAQIHKSCMTDLFSSISHIQHEVRTKVNFLFSSVKEQRFSKVNGIETTEGRDQCDNKNDHTFRK